MKVLITGISGFAGSHLAEYLIARGDVEVYGLVRWRSKLDNLQDLAARGQLNTNAVETNITCTEMLDACAQPGQVNLIQGDMSDAYSMRQLIQVVQPDRIFHLAAQSFVPASWNLPAETLTTNMVGEVNLLEAVREWDGDPLIQIAGSSEEYGLVLPDEVPIKETNPLRPLSPYAVSKVAQDLLAWQYHRSYGIKTVVTRGFNHTGPRRGKVFSTSTFAKQIAEIEKELRPPVIKVGDLSSKRDFTDVRDMVRAYWLALDQGVPGEVYNIGSGVTMEIGEMLNVLLSLSTVKVEVEPDPARMRPSDVKVLWADPSKFMQQTGWQPQIPFRQTMQDLLDYWRARVGQDHE
ncbi:MAG: GDP-mannose 4,6-dehydratase [Chloroflexi bacterium]|nr:GDP-mannose 4,6-dehydratase [Chloroflexota bacterium]MBU1751049.1 GDP-mannose 4,6-dehydratase [Chloroflexota bacterium]MBU1879088.1 GDP-mannose 4,6-dehydratase [Chloroflexota bacterium]